jgi:hypothetical protein
MKFIVYVVIAVALLCGLFVLFKPDAAVVPVATNAAFPSPKSATPSTPAPAQESSQASVATDAKSAPVAESGATLPERRDAGSTIDLVVANGRLVSGPSVTRVKQNETVVLHVTSDKADELHLHGYNLHLALKPNTVATLEIKTTRVGRFTYELHHLDLELGALEVYPR